MNHDEVRSRLDDYVDGVLSEDARRDVERHLGECPACAAEAAERADLLVRARELAVAVEPERDLWSGIEAALRPAAPEAPAPRRWFGAWGWAGGLAAAAVVAIVAGVLLRSGPADLAGTDPGARIAGVDENTVIAPMSLAITSPVVRALEAESKGAGKQLMAAYRAGAQPPAPEVSRALESNLKVLDRAIEESRRALAEDPGNPLLLRRLTGQYERRLAVIRRASRLAEQGWA